MTKYNTLNVKLSNSQLNKLKFGIKNCGTVMQWLSLLHNFIQRNLNSGSAQVQILFTVCRRFTMVRISLNAFRWSTIPRKQFIIIIIIIIIIIFITEVTLNLSSNLIGNSNDESNFPYKLLSTDTQAWRFCKAFANNSSANIKFSKTQVLKII